MFEATMNAEIGQTNLKSVEELQELADFELALIGGGTGAVDLY